MVFLPQTTHNIDPTAECPSVTLIGDFVDGGIILTIGFRIVFSRLGERTKQKCSFGGATNINNELIAVSDSPGNRVHLIDVEGQEVQETIPTESFPYDLYYLPWRDEVWVHTWGNATFDVINTKGRLERTHRAIKAHVQPGRINAAS